MIRVTIPALNREIDVNRLIGHITGKSESPTLVFLGGIHGNETAGIAALKNVLKEIKNSGVTIEGQVIALTGNMPALEKGIRFETDDLNRLWTASQIRHINYSQNGFSVDECEQIALYQALKEILSSDNGPYYFLDLHTTSAYTTPFVTISDSINNRKFSSKFKIPSILGIEEHLDGPLLSFINEFGHVALGFEAGQHDELNAIKNCEAFIWLALINAGCLSKKRIPDYKKYQKQLRIDLALKKKFYEIDYRFQIHSSDDFKMQQGFKNFDKIKKGQLLATNNSEPVYSPMSGYIFMPLYQQQGDDGFFIVTRISIFWLALSKVLRKIKFYHVLRILPGIRRSRFDKHSLIVNKKTARFLATEIFHLFGYRKKVLSGNTWKFTKRDRKVTDFT